MTAPLTRELTVDGYRLTYDEYGSGPRTVMLIHGLLLSRRMHGPLAADLAARGNRVICLDLLGHGDSERPRDMWRYSMSLFGEQVVGALDALDVDEVVLGGTSLGANVTLEAAVRAPERMRGLVIEMPVLDNALLGCAIAFAPLLLALTFGEPVTRLLAHGFSLVPRPSGLPLVPDKLGLLGDTVLDWVSQDPGPSAAIMQGLFFGRVAPPRSERSGIETRALVLGHPRDPIHPFSDSDMLVRELRNSRMVEAGSLLELRLSPDRLTGEIARFIDECWRPEAVAEDGGAAAAGASA